MTMELEDKLMFIPRFEVCLRGSVMSEFINSAVNIVMHLLSNLRECTILFREEMSLYRCQ